MLPVLDFPACHGLIIKFKALQVNDQSMREGFDTAPFHSINLHSCELYVTSWFVQQPNLRCGKADLFAMPQDHASAWLPATLARSREVQEVCIGERMDFA